MGVFFCLIQLSFFIDHRLQITIHDFSVRYALWQKNIGLRWHTDSRSFQFSKTMRSACFYFMIIWWLYTYLNILGQSPWSMAVGTIWEWSKLVPFFLGGVQLIWGEGWWQFFKINILAVKHLKINIMAWVPRKINK